MAQPDFWNNSDKAQQIVQQLKSMKVVIEPLKKALQACDDLSELAEMLDDDPSAEAEVLTELSQLELAVEQLELQSLLNGPLDSCGAILSVHAREGGLDANDWAEMLIGMYASWAQKHGYNAELVDRCDNEGAGITQATIIVRGPFAYGFLRGEEGIHRLVRISPYNAEGKRQTSFAAVDVSPEVEDSVEVEIEEKDVREDVYRASGAGGQHVNKTSSAIRLTHAPTGDNFFSLYPHMKDPGAGKLYPAVIACFNLDMVGRLRDNLVLQGIGSSSLWAKEIERRNAVVGMSLSLQNDSYLPTDASTFFLDGVPILSAFTGSHSEYHTPRDVPELLNYEGAAQTAKLMGLIARSVATTVEPPIYQEQKAPEGQGSRAVMTAYLGTIPDYAQGDIKGVMLSGVAKDGPASKAGVQGKDIIIELAGRKVENIYDYTYAIEAIKAGQETDIVVRRGSEELRMKIVPQSRQ